MIADLALLQSFELVPVGARAMYSSHLVIMGNVWFQLGEGQWNYSVIQEIMPRLYYYLVFHVSYAVSQRTVVRYVDLTIGAAFGLAWCCRVTELVMAWSKVLFSHYNSVGL
jgi:hypothetical protein